MGTEIELRRGGPRPGDVIAGKYKIEALLGRGAMGSVFAARNQGTGKRVALKWLLTERQSDLEMIARFEREARAAGRIDHPNVVSVYDVGRDGPSSFLVMELLKGYSLFKLMNQGPLPVEAAIQLIMPVLRGIGAAHENQVIHRDLKPENIFVVTAPDGTPRNTKVLDFGVSKMTDEMREGLSVTRTGMIIGTPYYMAPEQVRGAENLDHRIDIYAAGVILYEMLAGRPPFVAEHYSGLILEIATGTPPDLAEFSPGIDPGLEQVILTAMARERDERFADGRAFGEALEPYSGGVTFEVQHAEWTQRIKLPRASTPPAGIDRPRGLADSHAATYASIDVAVADEGTSEQDGAGTAAAEKSDAMSTSVERPVPSSESSDAWHVSVGEPEQKSRRGLVAALVGLAIVFAIGLVVVLGSGDDPEPLDAIGAQPVSGGEDTAEVAPVDETPPSAGEHETAELVASGDEEGSVEAPSDAVEEAPTQEAGSASMRGSMRRRRTPMTAEADTMSAAAEDTPSTSGMSHRAGSLTFEDF